MTRRAISGIASYSSDSTLRPAWRAASSSCPGAGVPGDRRVTPRKPTTAPSSGVASRAPARRGPSAPSGASRSSMIRSVGAAAHRRDQRDLVAIGEGRLGGRIAAVVREAHGRPARRETPETARRALARRPRSSSRPAGRARAGASPRARAASRTDRTRTRTSVTGAAWRRAARRRSAGWRSRMPGRRTLARRTRGARRCRRPVATASRPRSGRSTGRCRRTTTAPGASRSMSAARYARYSSLSASMKTMSNGPRSSGADPANASSAGALTTEMRASGRPARRQKARARSVRSRSGSMVTTVPSAGSASAIHSVE